MARELSTHVHLFEFFNYFPFPSSPVLSFALSYPTAPSLSLLCLFPCNEPPATDCGRRNDGGARCCPVVPGEAATAVTFFGNFGTRNASRYRRILAEFFELRNLLPFPFTERVVVLHFELEMMLLLTKFNILAHTNLTSQLCNRNFFKFDVCSAKPVRSIKGYLT